MATAMKAASLRSSSNAISICFRAANFHSTPVLDRKRRTFWDSGGGASRNSSKLVVVKPSGSLEDIEDRQNTLQRSNNVFDLEKGYKRIALWNRFNVYPRRFRKLNAKEALLRNVSAYAECLFQSWQVGDDYSEPSSSKGTSRNKNRYWTKEANKKGFDFGSQEPQWETYRGRRGGFQFCDGNVEEVETIFRSAFGGERVTYWSFINDDYSQWRDSSGYSTKYRRSWNSRDRSADYDTYEEYNESSESSLASDRLALGLSTCGPIKLEDVKSAYRACALKWHPDRHQGSSKAVAEEKFKLCSAAYQSLCDKLD